MGYTVSRHRMKSRVSEDYLHGVLSRRVSLLDGFDVRLKMLYKLIKTAHIVPPVTCKMQG